ncbi:hypothetical protein QVD17_09928 [Tagetes erecta]|uniref:Uncharacterized protein n=1 Tax=Tagetes erecta TaxID=13708 RepID=A0AAD8P5H3_TARER|nr:hypothetical protein QVD17_09928 [Tagetes erecta]
MKRNMTGRLKLPTEEEVEVVEVLLDLHKLIKESESMMKIVSVLVQKPKRIIDESRPEKVKSPKTLIKPFKVAFVSINVSGIDGCGNR